MKPKILLLLALVVGAVVSNSYDDEYEQIKRVMKSWKHSAPKVMLDMDYYAVSEDHSAHIRSKRSISILAGGAQNLAADKSCTTPGYTGEFCEFPICDQTNDDIPDEAATDGYGATFDNAHLANCSENYVILVDETMYDIRLELEAEGQINPYLVLTAEDGSVDIPEIANIQRTPTSYIATWPLLAPGRYVVTPFADLYLKDFCILIGRAKTPLTLSGGFANGLGPAGDRSDFPDRRSAFMNQVKEKACAYHKIEHEKPCQLTTLMLHPNRARSPATLRAVTFTGQENIAYRPQRINTRYNCGYEYFFDKFFCQTAGEHLYHVEGVTFKGYGFRRVSPFTCVEPPTTTTTQAPSTTAPSVCKNDGVLVNPLDPKVTPYCFCQGLWQGADCNKIICMNGGTVTSQNTCNCGGNFGGNHCQDIICQDVQGISFDTNSPTLTLIIRANSAMNDVIQQVTMAVNQLYIDLQFDPTYLTRFILVTFNNNELIINERYSTFSDFLSDLNITANSVGFGDECSDISLSAVAIALSRLPTLKSPVYLITDVVPNDIDQFDNIFHQNAFYQLPLNVIFVKPAPRCDVAPDSLAYRTLEKMAKQSSGTLFFVSDRATVYNLMYQHMSATVYKSQLMLGNDFGICSAQNTLQSVAVDNDADTLTIIGTGSALNLTVTMPEGFTYNIRANNMKFSDGQNFIWTIVGPHTGVWLFALSSGDGNAPCSLKILQKTFQATGPQGKQRDMFVSFANNINNDATFAQPLQGFPLSPVIQLNNYGEMVLPEQLHGNLHVYAVREGEQKDIYFGSGIWRDGCSYNFYFPPMTCYVPDETLYFNFFVRSEIDGVDLGAIQRAGNLVCASVVPTQKPPTDCQNGGIINPMNTTCYCPLGYSGRFCEQLVCPNGGTPNSMGTYCSCPLGWTGTICEIPKCIQQGFPPELVMEAVDMVFALELTENGIVQVTMLNDNFASLLHDITIQHPFWIAKFILVGFNSTWSDVMYIGYPDDTNALVMKLDEITRLTFTDSNKDKNCGVQIAGALDMAVLKGDIRPGSFVEIFMSSTPANDDYDWDTLYNFMRGLDLRLTTFLGVSPRNKTPDNPVGYFCNGTVDDFSPMYMLTGSSLGTIYPLQQGNAGQLIKTIPLQYFSGVVMSKWQEDCSEGVQIYFPIDSYVQTIQLDIYGTGATVVLADQAGIKWVPTTIIQDSFSGLTIAEVRKPCDPSWSLNGQYCYFFGIDHGNHQTAMDYCHASGAQLVNDLTPSKHMFIQGQAGPNNFWLGLYKNNESVWYWDRPNDVAPAPLQQTDTWWEGGIPPTDPNLNCAFFKGPNTYQSVGDNWVASDCGVDRFFMCEKLAYDKDYIPNSLDKNDLPPGVWNAKVTTNAPVLSDRSCYLTVRVQSSLQLITGYTTDQTQDWPNVDPIRDSDDNRIMTYLHTKDNQNEGGRLFSAYINDAYNTTFYDAVQYGPRIECAWPWISQTFNCPNSVEQGNEFIVTHSGEDAFGFFFQRQTTGHCTRQDLNCGNGGVRYQGKCYCDEYWRGQYCTVPICVNGGNLTSDDTRCNCLDGYVGFNCQYQTCDVKAHATFPAGSKTFILAVEWTKQNQPAIDALTANFAAIMANAVENTDSWFINYFLVTYDSNGVKSIDEFMNAEKIQKLLNDKKGTVTDEGSCSTPMFSVLQTLFMKKNLELIQLPNSELFVVSSAGASDIGSSRDDLMILSDYNLMMTYLFMYSDKCGQQPADGSLPTIARTAYTSNGNVAFMDASNLVKFLNSYLPTRYRANVLSNPTYRNGLTCESASWLIQVDQNTTQLYVTVSATYGSLAVTNSLGQPLGVTPLYNVENTKLYQIDTDSKSGIYTVNYSSIGACYASIYSVGGPNVFTRYSVVTDSNPTGSRQDGNWHSPIANQQNVLTAHLEGTPDHRGQLQYVEIFDVDKQLMIIRSELYLRINADTQECTFEYVSDAFSCDTDILAVYIYGMDEFNQQFRRQTVAYCEGNTVTTQPPPVTGLVTGTPLVTGAVTTVTTVTAAPITTTVGVTGTTPTKGPTTTSYGYNNMRFDVYFLIDVTPSTTNTIKDIISFIKTLMVPFNVGQDGVRVGLIPVMGGQGDTLTVAQLNSIKSQSEMNGYLAQITSDWMDDTVGQYIADAITLTVDPNNLLQGYRVGIPNHLVVYITSTTTFSDDPTAIVKQIRDGSQFGFITVGYGPNLSSANLKTISGQDACTFNTADVNQLNTSVLTSIQQLIWNADFTGVYCAAN